jgi:glyoxylase-like metal-dependent hydrolase (beta-lactamase superfamily II)
MFYTIRLLHTGYQYLDKGNYATFRKGIGTILEMPVFAFLLEGGGRKILVDTGMSDTEHSVRYHHDGRQEPGQAIYEQLDAAGIACDEIGSIIFTHLHWDHCFNLDYFPNAELFASRIEYEFAQNPIPFYWASYEYPEATGLVPPFFGREFNLTEGEVQLYEGIRIIPTPGHSPGHIAVTVDTTDGTYIIVGDLMFLRENLQPSAEHGWPFMPPGRFCNIIDVWKSYEKVLSIAKSNDFVLMTHDPSQMGVSLIPEKL